MEKLAYITGAFGFIGSHVAARLAGCGWKVAGIGLGGPDAAATAPGPVFLGPVTVANLVELQKTTGTPDALIHCAGSGSVAASLADPLADFSANVATLAETLDFCRLHAPACRIVVPSSAAVYGEADSPIREDAPLRPISPYGVHKRMAEDLCRSYASNYGLHIAIARLFSVYGPGLRKQLLWDACRKAASGDFSFQGTGRESRDWLHVADAARLLHLLADVASPVCPIFNGGSGVGASVAEITGFIGHAWEPGLTPEFTGATRAGDPTVYLASCEKVRQTGFEPRIPLQEGLLEYVRWFRQQDHEEKRR